MATTVSLSPHIHRIPQSTSCESRPKVALSSSFSAREWNVCRRKNYRSSRPGFRCRPSAISASTASVRDQANALASAELAASTPDATVAQLVETLSTSLPVFASQQAEQLVQSVRSKSLEAALAMPWPTRRDEDFRFTDVAPLRELALEGKAADASAAAAAASGGARSPALDPLDGPSLVLANGVLRGDSCRLEGLPAGVVVGSLRDLDEEAVQRFVAPYLGSNASTDLFSALNGASFRDVLVIGVPAGAEVLDPIRIVHVAQAGSAAVASSAASSFEVSSPRVLVVVEEGGEVNLVEDFLGGGDGGGSYWVNSVVEIVVKAKGRVTHASIVDDSRGAFNTRRTFVAQEESSRYEIVEAALGARLSRHAFQLKQQGADTETLLSTFALAGNRQVHDLHSSLVLDHPRGITRQLHKCIVTDSSGQAVFDGNVKVNRFAQQTDAQQLSRSLLLAPRGTVNLKPNLQIIADDVKCTHGAAISDLEEEQLFYFLARGINEQTARSALVFSFGAEVVEKIPYKKLRVRVEESIKQALSRQGAMDSVVASKLTGGSEE